MRVLHIISSGGMYGAEAVILSLSHELNREGKHLGTLGVFAHQGQPVPTLHEVASASNLDSALLPCQGQIDRTVPEAIRALAKSTGADVIHAHGYKADLYIYFAFRGRRDRPALVSTCHTWYDNDVAVRIYGALDRWVLRSFDEVVAVSEDVRRRLLGSGVREERIHLIRNGIAVNAFDAAIARRSERHAAGGSLRIGLVGRLAPEKGVDIFLRACARLAPRFSEAQFVVAGDGPDRESLAALLKELGLEGRAQLIGRQTDMPAFFAATDILVSASRHEGLPIALLEGMASGLPVVATRVGSVPLVVAEAQTGLLVASEDPVGLSEAMGVLMGDAAQREAFGSAGRQRVQEHFSAQRMAADYLAVYNAAVKLRPAAVGSPRAGEA